MVTTTPMLQVQRLALVDIADAAPGQLLITPASYGDAPYLGFVDANETEQRKYILPLFTDERSPHHIIHAAELSGQWLAIDAWRLEVDPASKFIGTRESPERGDAFISGGVAGLVGGWKHGDGYVSTSGGLLPEPRWTGDFVGFRSWSIVLDMGLGQPPAAIITRKRLKGG